MSLKVTYHQGDAAFPAEGKKVKTSHPGTLPHFSDQQIWAEFKNGNEAAYAEIYKIHALMLYNYGTKLSRDKQLVKDCIQDLFITLWNSRNQLGAVKSVKSYLYRCIRRKILKEISKSKRFFNPVSQNNYEFQVVCSPELHLINQQNSEEQIKNLQKGLQHLTKRQKEAIFLKYYDKLSYEEVAAVMGISTKATYKIIARAIKLLKQRVERI